MMNEELKMRNVGALKVKVIGSEGESERWRVMSEE
jgi:hypothetical protein